MFDDRDVNAIPSKGDRAELMSSVTGHTSNAAPPPSLAGILVVEDDGLLRYAAVNTLTELGYRVFPAADALEALGLLEENPDIGVVMTDIKLPGMDGKQLAAEARRRHPQVKILYVTGYSERVIEETARTD